MNTYTSKQTWGSQHTHHIHIYTHLLVANCLQSWGHVPRAIVLQELPDDTQDDELRADEDWEDSEAEGVGEEENSGEEEEDETQCVEDSEEEKMDVYQGESSGSDGKDPNPRLDDHDGGSVFDDDDDDDDDEPSNNEKIPSSGSQGVKNPKAESLEFPPSDGSTPSLDDQIQELQRKLALAKKEYTAKTPD